MRAPPKKDTEWIDKIRAEKGIEPRKREGEVDPYQDLIWVWVGFWRLSNSRPQGMSGPMRIPFSEIRSYVDLMCWGYQQVQDFIFYVERLDAAFMEWVSEQRDEEDRKRSNKGGKTPLPPPRPKRIGQE